MMPRRPVRRPLCFIICLGLYHMAAAFQSPAAPLVSRQATAARSMRRSRVPSTILKGSGHGRGGEDGPPATLSRREQLTVLVPAILGLAYGTTMLKASLEDDQLYDAKHREIFAVLLSQGRRGCPPEVLEIGIGGGANTRYYPKGTLLTGIDPGITEQSSTEIEAKARAQGVEVRRLIKGEAESMPFLPDNTFDVVVSTLVLCTVRDPAQVLAEVHRVLRPGGKYCFIEHIKAPPGTFLAKQQEVLDPLQQVLANGCHLTRQNDELLLAHTEGQGSRASPPLFSSMEHLEYLDLGSRWPVSRQVIGILNK